MKFVRFVLATGGAVAVTVGVILTVAGIGVVRWAGDDVVQLPVVSLSTDGVLVTEPFGVVFGSDTEVFMPQTGTASVTVSADGQELFVGIARAEDVATAMAADADLASLDFWRVAETGTAPTVSWDLTQGEWRFVAVPTDGSALTRITVDPSVSSGPVRLTGFVVIAIGLVSSIAGGIIMAVTMRPSPTGPASAAPRRTAMAA